LLRVQTVWGGVAGSPYYTNWYCIGPLTTNNGATLHNATHNFLISLQSTLAAGLTAQVQPEILEFNEADGVVTNAGAGNVGLVTFSGLGDQIPHSNQALIQWTTNGIVHNRRVRGRTFIPGALEAENSPTGTPLPAVGNPLQTAIDTLLSTTAGTMRIWARPYKSKGAEDPIPPRPGSAHAIVSGKVAPYWAVLRSRRD